jgi:hypothetical protein
LPYSVLEAFNELRFRCIELLSREEALLKELREPFELINRIRGSRRRRAGPAANGAIEP